MKSMNKKEKALIVNGFKNTGLSVVQERYPLFCQEVTIEELKSSYALDKNNNLIRLNDFDGDIVDIPDCVKKFYLILLYHLPVTNSEMLELVDEINNTEDCSVCIWIGSGSFSWWRHEDDQKYIRDCFHTTMSPNELYFTAPVEEYEKIREDEAGYFMADIFDCFYNTKTKEIGYLDGGGCCPLTFIPFTNEKSGKTTVFKVIRTIVDNPINISVSETEGLMKCDLFGCPDENGDYFLNEKEYKVYSVDKRNKKKYY